MRPSVVYSYYMHSLFDRIQELIQDDTVRFVFPSEISARYWRHASLALTPRRAVWGDRFLSWDRFKELSFGLTETRRPANGIVRTLFAVSVARENRETPFLERLLPGDGGEAGGTTRELARILPRLHALVPRIGEQDWPLARDLREVEGRYSAFLEDNGLYEPSTLTPSLERLDGPFLLVFPETLEDYDAYRHLIEEDPRIELFSPRLTPQTPIEIYPNERIEATALFNRIRKLIIAGVPPTQIAITLPDIREKRGYIEEAAHRFEIPLEFRTGRGLTEYSSVRFFRALAQLESGSWELSAFKNLVLNLSIPWKEPAALGRLIRDGIESYVLRNWQDSDGHHGWEEQLTRAGKKESLALYRRFQRSVRAITGAAGFRETTAALQAFIGTFLDTARWQNDESVQLKAFQRGLEILNEFALAAEQLGDTTVDSPLSVWIASLEEATYVEQQERPGIAVYPYRVSVGIDPPYHFIPFLTQESSRVLWDRGFPLNEAQRDEAAIEDQDVSEIYLALYLDSSGEVIPSCSLQGYGGPALPPGLFVEKGLEREATITTLPGPEAEDEYFFQTGAPPRGPSTAWQREGFAAFMATGGVSHRWNLLDDPLPHAGMAEELKTCYFRSGPGARGISATALDAFSGCPFSFLFTGILELEELEYHPLVRDHRLEGILIHRVLETFHRNLEEGRFLSARLAEYRDALRAILRREAAEITGPLPVKPAWNAALRQLEEILLLYPEAEARLFDGFTGAGSERNIQSRIDGIPLNGRIDRIARGPAGELLVVDYKKGFRLRKSELSGEAGVPLTMQLPFYVLLLAETGVCRNTDEVISAYYIASEGRYKILSSAAPLSGSGSRPVVNEEGFEHLLQLTRTQIREMAARIARGDYRTGVDECAGCPLRPLCRRRYIVQGVR